MERKKIDALNALERLEIGGKRGQTVAGQGEPRDHDMADPDRFSMLFAVIKRGERVPVGVSGQIAAERIVQSLDVQQEHVGKVDDGSRTGKRIGTRGVDCRVQIFRTAAEEDVGSELRLGQRFSARKGHPAAQEIAAGYDFFHDLAGSDGASVAEFPGIGIVAIPAPQRTALKKNDEAHPRSVKRTETFIRMNASGDAVFHDQNRLWKVLLTTSSCCSRVSLMKLTA